MHYDERLIGRKPSEDHIQKSRARLDDMFRQRFEQREALRNEQLLQQEPTMRLLRKMAESDKGIEEAVKEARARSIARAKKPLHKPVKMKVGARTHLGSIDVTFVPPFTWPWQWSAQTGSATADVSADANSGTMSFDAWTGEDGKTASCAVAVGSFFQPITGVGIMDVSAIPSFTYVWDSSNVLDSSHTGAFIGLYVGQYTLGGDFVQAVVDQQISLWDSGGGSDQGSNSG